MQSECTVGGLWTRTLIAVKLAAQTAAFTVAAADTPQADKPGVAKAQAQASAQATQCF